MRQLRNKRFVVLFRILWFAFTNFCVHFAWTCTRPDRLTASVYFAWMILLWQQGKAIFKSVIYWLFRYNVIFNSCQLKEYQTVIDSQFYYTQNITTLIEFLGIVPLNILIYRKGCGNRLAIPHSRVWSLNNWMFALSAWSGGIGSVWFSAPISVALTHSNDKRLTSNARCPNGTVCHLAEMQKPPERKKLFIHISCVQRIRIDAIFQV